MKVYGFEDVGPARGEMVAAKITGIDLKLFTFDELAGSLTWEHMDSSFTRAKVVLLERMQEEGAASFDIEAVRRLKAREVPVVYEGEI